VYLGEDEMRRIEVSTCVVKWSEVISNRVSIIMKKKTQTHTHIYMGCPRRNVRDFGRVFLMLNYTDITQNTYVQSRTVKEIMAREKCRRHRRRHTVCRP